MTPHRDDLIHRFQAIRDSLVDSAASLAGIRSDILNAADRQTMNGHHGIADAYLSASQQGEDITDLLTVADDALQAAITTITTTDGPADPGIGGPTAAPKSVNGLDRTDSRPTPPLAGFSRMRPHPGAMEALQYFGWPTNPDGKVSARAHLYDLDGRRIDDVDVMKAHRKGRAPPCDDLKEPWRSDPEYTTTWHAERDAAQIMRQRGITEAVLYLNIPPCGRRDQDPKRCEANLRKLIPRGSNLWIWSIREGKAPRLRRYEGTGEAIR